MDYKINAPTDGDEMIFRHADIFFSCFFNDENHCVHQSREHAMNYVYSGEMLIDDGNKITHVQKGECVFIRRDHRVTLTKKTTRWRAVLRYFSDVYTAFPTRDVSATSFG